MVPDIEEEVRYVLCDLQPTRLKTHEAKIKQEGRVEWSGIVDNNYRHAAIKLVMEIDESWKDFKWLVTTLKTGYAMKVTVVCKNSKRKTLPLFYLHSEFVDLFCNLKAECSRLQLRGGKLLSAEVPESYSGGCKYRTFSLRQVATTAIRPG